MKFVFCQISNKLINPKTDSIAEKFQDTFFKNKHKDGYYRPEHFWELPKWIAEICYVIPDEHQKELLIIDDIKKGMALSSDKDVYYCFSVLDVNKNMVKSIIDFNPQSQFILGGYVDFKQFYDYKNAMIFDSIESFAMGFMFEYSYGCDWSLFEGIECIPRLTLSKGCLNGCKFCTVPHKLEELTGYYIWQQIVALKKLRFKLVYIDDKTFGQAKNCNCLEAVYPAIKSCNPDFEGFIVQTTAKEILIRDKDFWSDNHIKIVEIGVETLNDDILKQYRKPHTVMDIHNATTILWNMGIKVIWNIIIGFSEETEDTYRHTLDFIRMYKPGVLYSLNVFHLAMYGSNKDTDENSNVKSWLDSDQQKIADAFEEQLYKLGLEIIK